MKAGGGFLAVVGGILALIGFIWGTVIGYYSSELPALLVVLVLGAALLGIGAKMYSSAPDDRVSKPYVPPTASTHWLAASTPPAPPAPTVAPAATPESEIGPSTSAGRLAALAANPDLWAQIEAHPNAYPSLLDWIRTQREEADAGESDAGESDAGESDAGESDAVVRASDPATPPAELAELAERHPELRAAIAANPAAYPALREWIAQNGSE